MICPKCNGTGYYVYNYTDASGQRPRDTCKRCHGTGQVPDQDVCPKCATVNPVRCMYGDGCFNKTPEGLGKCSICDGTRDASEGWWCNLCH